MIDLQKDFVTGTLPVPGGANIIGTTGHLVLLARQKNADVVFSCDQHNNPDPEFKKWPVHCVAGTKGALMIIQPEPYDIVIRKGSFEYSAFAPRFPKHKSSMLKLALNARKINTVILTGLAYDFCVGQTALDAAKLGFEIFVVEDCTAAVSEKTSERMRAELDAAGVKHVSFMEAAKMLGSID